MGIVWRVLGFVLLAALAVGVYAGYRIGFGHPFTINQLADRQAIAFVARNPEIFTQIGVIDGTFLDRHSGKLAPVGVAKRDEDYANAEKYLAEVRRFDRAKLSVQDQITFDILEDQYESALAFRQFPWVSSEGVFPVNQMVGTNVSVPWFLLSGHTIKNPKLAETYVQRLEATGAKIDGVVAEMKRQEVAGVILPAALVTRTIAITKDTIAPEPAQSPFVKKLEDATASMKGLEGAEREALRARAVAAVTQGIYPAYARLVTALEAVLPAAQSQGAGIGRLADGAALYSVILRQQTTTEYTPDQVHQIGLDEVARITAEMDAILRAQGLSEGTVAARIEQLNVRPDQLYPNTDEGRAQIIARYNEIMREIEARMPQYFATIPAGELKVERVPDALEKGAARASYQPAAMDGSRPGTFFANLRDTAETPKYTMKTLAYHEGVPGHHFQVATGQSLKGLPLIRQQTLYTAYAEGWALYAERLAAEIGMYKDDPLGDLGRLQAEIFRAARLVVDTGLHAKGWSREQAIAYMVSTTGMSETDVTTEVERYMAMPGQACAYKVGQLKILELREEARTALGGAFDLKAFHTMVLENGGVPLTVLERLVDDWVAKQKGQGAGA
ncbi:MAG: DUF885 domain-containing protein [Hyphomonadaceae bacterium]|nr:DUF885 domain-containing protein [Hyphomonadaceae bacterium]